MIVAEISVEKTGGSPDRYRLCISFQGKPAWVSKDLRTRQQVWGALNHRFKVWVDEETPKTEEDTMCQKAHLENWEIEEVSPKGTYGLLGNAYNHPGATDGARVHTSALRSLDFAESKATTLDIDYTLGAPANSGAPSSIPAKENGNGEA